MISNSFILVAKSKTTGVPVFNENIPLFSCLKIAGVYYYSSYNLTRGWLWLAAMYRADVCTELHAVSSDLSQLVRLHQHT